MVAMTIDPAMSVQHLITSGVLNKSISFQVQISDSKFLSIYNRVNERRLLAEFTYDSRRSATEPYQMCINEESCTGELAVVSIYSHADLEHLVRTAKGFLCCYAVTVPSKVAKKGGITVRVDDNLRELFDEAVRKSGESQAVVLRQLLRFYVRKGPDPRPVA